MIQAKLAFQDREHNVAFVVARVNSQPILGLQTCERLGLIKRIHVINKEAVRGQSSTQATNQQTAKQQKPDGKCQKLVKPENSSVKGLADQYAKVFEGIGCLPVTHKIQLHEGAYPVIHTMRAIPESVKPRLEEERNELEKKWIVTRIKEPTDWVNCLVIVEKPNGKLCTAGVSIITYQPGQKLPATWLVPSGSPS